MAINAELENSSGAALTPSEGTYPPDLMACFAGPIVMKTILDMVKTENEWLVKLAADLPGGIGNTGFCMLSLDTMNPNDGRGRC